MSKIFSFLLILLWSEIYLFSVIPHTTHPSYLSGPMDTKSQGAVLPNSMKKGKNLERLLARHIFKNNSCVLGQ
jgi:hypothetical protein